MMCSRLPSQCSKKTSSHYAPFINQKLKQKWSTVKTLPLAALLVMPKGGVGMFHTEGSHRVSSQLGNPPGDHRRSHKIFFQRKHLTWGDISKSCSQRDPQRALPGCTAHLEYRVNHEGVEFLLFEWLKTSSRHPRKVPPVCVGAVSPNLSCKTDTGTPAWQTAGKIGAHCWW